jgi:hypothetical protein
MKSILSLVLFLFILSLASAASAAPENNWIVGHWRYAEQGRSSDYIYRGDSTFTANVALQGKVVWKFAGTWSIDGDMLNYQYTQSSIPQVPVGKKGGDKLIDISKDYFVLQTVNHEQRRYNRVQ